jgi:hypothetical protein
MATVASEPRPEVLDALTPSITAPARVQMRRFAIKHLAEKGGSEVSETKHGNVNFAPEGSSGCRIPLINAPQGWPGRSGRRPHTHPSLHPAHRMPSALGASLRAEDRRLISPRLGCGALKPREGPHGGLSQKSRGRQSATLADLLLTGRLVSGVNLPRLLPNAGNLLHRKEACQLDVLYGTG